jgi:cell division protein FtsB
MPTELKVRDGSESGALALREFKREIGKIENEWTLTDEIARKILEMLQQGEILFDFDI